MTLRHLPWASVQRSKVLEQVRLNEYPAPAGLGAGHNAGLGALAQSLRVHVQQVGGLFQG